MDRYTYRGEGEYPLAYISDKHYNHDDGRITGFAPERLAAYEDTGLTPDEIAALRAELDAAQRRADSAVGWADCIVDVMISSRRGIVEERFSALAGYRKWRETDRRGPDAPSKEAQP